MTEEMFWLIKSSLWITGAIWPAYGLLRKYLKQVHLEKMTRWSK